MKFWCFKNPSTWVFLRHKEPLPILLVLNFFQILPLRQPKNELTYRPKIKRGPLVDFFLLLQIFSPIFSNRDTIYFSSCANSKSIYVLGLIGLKALARCAKCAMVKSGAETPCYVCFWNQHNKCSHQKHYLSSSMTHKFTNRQTQKLTLCSI